MSREQSVRDAVDRFVTRLRHQTDVELQTLADELLLVVQGDGGAGRVDLERAAVDVARAAAKGGSQARHDLIARVVLAMRRLDDAQTLTAILDALRDGAAAEAARVAVLLVDGDHVRVYRHHGFSPASLPQDLPIAASPILDGSVRLRQATRVSPGGDFPDPTVPAFLRVPAGHLGLMLPVVVAKQAAALVYADGPNRESADGAAPVWSEQVEVLVRHAASRLENVTSQRTVEVLTHPS